MPRVLRPNPLTLSSWLCEFLQLHFDYYSSSTAGILTLEVLLGLLLANHIFSSLVVALSSEIHSRMKNISAQELIT